MNLLFVDRAFTRHLGGIERVCAGLADEMTQRGHRCFVMADNEDAAATPVLDVNPSIETVNLPFLDTPEQRRRIRSRIEAVAPDAVIVMTGSVGRMPLLWPVILKDTGIPLIASEHHCPEFVIRQWDEHERLVYLAAADAIHLLFPSFLASLPDFLHSRARAIANPIGKEFATEESGSATDMFPKRVIAVGSLQRKQKQFDVLIQAFSIIAGSFPEWVVDIWGTGPDKQHFTQLIERLGLSKKIFLRGVTKNIAERFRESDIFCMPSSFEGCPCALQEAMASGLPGIGFRECPGVNELIADGETGVLAREMTPEALAKALVSLMNDKTARQRFGRNARQKSSAFSGSRLYDAWEDMIKNAAKKKGATVLSETIDIAGPEYLRCELEILCTRQHVIEHDNETITRLENELKNITSSRLWNLLLRIRKSLPPY